MLGSRSVEAQQPIDRALSNSASKRLKRSSMLMMTLKMMMMMMIGDVPIGRVAAFLRLLEFNRVKAYLDTELAVAAHPIWADDKLKITIVRPECRSDNRMPWCIYCRLHAIQHALNCFQMRAWAHARQALPIKRLL